jgi:hypothetical protein
LVPSSSRFDPGRGSYNDRIANGIASPNLAITSGSPLSGRRAPAPKVIGLARRLRLGPLRHARAERVGATFGRAGWRHGCASRAARNSR